MKILAISFHPDDETLGYRNILKNMKVKSYKMKKNNTLLFGVIYQDIDRYLLDYCNSIESQDTNHFDILIINDKYKGILPLNNKRTYIINIEDNITHAEIRMLGIKYAIENDYEYIIFSDTDDYFSSNRISVSINKLKKYDFVFNELYLINEKKDIIQRSYYNDLLKKVEYTNYLEIINRNLFGLGNAAVKVNKLKDLFIPKEMIATDWWIFSILLLKKNSGGFIKEAITYYRQHNNNFVGISKKINKNKIKLGIKVKGIHYKNLVLYCENNNLPEAKEIYRQKINEIDELNKYIQDDKFCKKYIEVINKNYSKIYNGWWSEILPISEWRKYDE